MQTQPTLVPVTMLAADSPAAHQRFPALDHPRTTRVLTVVAADGAVYEGERAWLVCGWSLPAWRPLVEHVGDGPRIHLVRAAAHLVDAYRHRSMAGRPTAGCSRCVIATPDPNWPPPAWEARRASGDR
jgi:hypothetical protein